MLTCVRNAYSSKKEVVEVKNSKIHEGILKILKDEGFISNYKLIKDNKQGLLRCYLKYDEEKSPALTGIKRISKPSLRIYKGKEEIPSVYGGLGVAIISTSKGLMTDKEAREKGVGGEVLCYAW
jgi:small subunit ribosomal protein S8